MIRYYHYRVAQSDRGGVTIAVDYIEEKSLLYGYAVCCPDDVFNRARGRLIAAGRLFKRPAACGIVKREHLRGAINTLAVRRWRTVRMRHADCDQSLALVDSRGGGL